MMYYKTCWHGMSFGVHFCVYPTGSTLSLEASEKMEVTIPPMKTNPLYDVKPNELYDEIPSNTAILANLVSPTANFSDKYNNQFFHPEHNFQPKLPPPRKMSVTHIEPKPSPVVNVVCDNDSDKEDYVEMSAVETQSSSSQPKSPISPNQPLHVPGRNSLYSTINGPPTTAHFQQRYSLNTEDDDSSHYSHLQNATIV